jgi:hypothetical protein
LIRRTVIKPFIKYCNEYRIYDRIKQLKPINIFFLLKKILLGRFVLFIVKSILDYSLNFSLYDGLLLIIWFIAFIIYIVIKFNVKSRINSIYLDLCGLYKQDNRLFIYLIFIAYVISQLLFLLLFGILSPFGHIYFVAILVSVLKTSLFSFIDISPNNTIRFMNAEGSSNSSQLRGSGSNNTSGSNTTPTTTTSTTPTTVTATTSTTPTTTNTDQEIHDFDGLRRSTGAKLRNLYINRPANVRMAMNAPHYADTINRLDHNVVCRAILDSESKLKKYIDDSTGEIWYKGHITLELLYILER